MVTPWRPLDLYLNFGMGFHSNDARIAVQEGKTTPEGSVLNTVPWLLGGELGARLSLFDKRLGIAAALWASYLQNETVFSGDGAVFVPSDPSRRWGVDVEVRARPLRWLSFDFDLSQAASETLADGKPAAGLALAPRLYFTGGTTLQGDFHAGGLLSGGLRFRYLGERPAFDTNSPEYTSGNATEARRVNTEAWFVMDLYVAYRLRAFEIATQIQNLLASEWREAQFGNRSCTQAEASSAADPNYARCGASLPNRPGVADVHYTPGVPFNLNATAKVYF